MTAIALPNMPQGTSQGTIVEQSRAVAEVAAAVRVAQDFPRNVDRALAQTGETCRRLSIAQRAFYEVPNRGAGMSVHIARELARIWGNIDYGVRELHRDDEEGVSEMQAWAWDQETNTRSTRSFIQPHARMARGSRQKLTDLGDIYLANQNTGARAVRECIFSVLPGWLLSDAENILRKTLVEGDGKPLEQRRADAVGRFAEVQVSQRALEIRVGKPLSEWTPQILADLSRVYATITQDGIPAVEFFPETPVEIPAVKA